MQNLISFGGVPKIPPSELGFVCKPEMPPHINILFRSRPPMPFIPLQQRNITRHYSGVFQGSPDLMSRFDTETKPIEDQETKQIMKLKALAEKLVKQKEINKDKQKEWEPKSNPNATKDPYKTIFVYHLDPKIDEKRLQKEFEFFGEIRKLRIIRDLAGKSRGYGFIEFKHSSHCKYAEQSRQKKIKNKVVCIDYERGRTEKGWKPKRFGGGKGDNRAMPKWLTMQLDYIKNKYPELIKEKGEISDGQFLSRKKRRNSDNGTAQDNDNDQHQEKKKNNNNEDNMEVDDENADDDDKTIKEDNNSLNEKEEKMSSSKKEYEVGEIV